MNHAERVEIKKRQLLAAAAKLRSARAPKKLPTSGGEELFTDVVYGSRKGVEGNNCFGAAIDYYRDGGFEKLQPGELARTARADDDLTKCPVLKRRVLEDLASKRIPGGAPGGYVVSPSKKCRADYYKIMSFSAPNHDYHFYRQVGTAVIENDRGERSTNDMARDMGVETRKVSSPTSRLRKGDRVLVGDSGLWVHKRGLDELSVRDASGRFIRDPRHADRKYGPELHYTRYCNSFCVHKDFGRGE